MVGFGTDSPIWHLIEFGGPYNPPHRVLSNAALSIGYRVELK